MKGLVLYERGKTEIREVENRFAVKVILLLKSNRQQFAEAMYIFIMDHWILVRIRLFLVMNLPVRLQKWDQKLTSISRLETEWYQKILRMCVEDARLVRKATM